MLPQFDRTHLQQCLTRAQFWVLGILLNLLESSRLVLLERLASAFGYPITTPRGAPEITEVFEFASTNNQSDLVLLHHLLVNYLLPSGSDSINCDRTHLAAVISIYSNPKSFVNFLLPPRCLGEGWGGVKNLRLLQELLYSGSQKSEVCPMPYALCPMPYALCPWVPHMRDRKAILLVCLLCPSRAISLFWSLLPKPWSSNVTEFMDAIAEILPLLKDYKVVVIGYR